MEETVRVLVINLLGEETACGLRTDKFGTVFLGKELLGLFDLTMDFSKETASGL